MKPTIQVPVSFLFILGIAMFLIAAFLTVFWLNATLERINVRNEVQNYQKGVKDFRSSIRTAFIGHRDFLLTGNPIHRGVYDANKAQAIATMEQMGEAYPLKDTGNMNGTLVLAQENFHLMDSCIHLFLISDTVNLDKALEKNRRNFIAASTSLDRLEEQLQVYLNGVLAHINQMIRNMKITIILVYIFGFLLLSISLYILTKDIKKRKAGEETINKQAQNLKDLKETRDKFFSLIAHDLRSPMNSLLGFANLFRNKAIQNDPETLEKLANNLYKSTKNAINLLDNLLKWSMLQTGSLKVKLEQFDLYEVALEIILLYSDIAQIKGVAIHNELKPSTWCYADKNIVLTVLRNFVNNAIKFSFPNGEIKINYEEDNGQWKVMVTDNGVGITPAIAEKLFNTDLEHTSKGTSQEESAGMGLVICKELTAINNGRVGAVSLPKSGSMFFFTVPREREMRDEG